MSISKTAVMRPTTVLIIFAVLAALGMYATLDLPLDLLPDIELPYVAISTIYPGAGPEEVERSISRPIESAVSGVSGIDELGSSSSYSSSIVFLKLTFGSNLDEAMNDIRAKLDFVKGTLPDDAETPMIFKMDPTMIPIMFYAISGNRTPEELREYTDDLVPLLEQIDGVASAFVVGGREQAIEIEIPRDRLQAYNLTITQVAQMIGAQNVQIPAGNITEANLNYTISTVGEYENLEDIRDTVITYRQTGTVEDARTGGPMPTVSTVRLRDIANVSDGYKEQTSMYYFNGVPCVQMAIQKQSGTNSVQTARAVTRRIEEIKLNAPSDIVITETNNTTDIIQRSVNNVASSAIQGAIFAIFVLLIFLRSLRSTIIIGLTIPISLIVTLGIMFFSGMTLNIMTLAGLALGVGMLVDNSIVILENIYTYRAKGAKPVPAAILGSQEMALAISGSTLTTICVFLPLIMYRKQLEIIGEIFQGLAFTVVISLACSLIVAIVLVPVLTSKYFKIGGKEKKVSTGFIGKMEAKLGRFFDRLDEKYYNAIRWVLKHKALTIGVIAGLFLTSVACIPLLGFVYMPEAAADKVTLDITLPVGTSLETTEAVLKQLEQIVIREVTDYKNITLLAGSSGSMGMGSSSYKGKLTIALHEVSIRKEGEEEIKTKLRAHFDKFPGTTFAIGSGGMGVGGGDSAIQIKIKADDLAKARETADAIKLLLSEQARDYVTEPTLSMEDGLPQVDIVIDRQRLYSLGLNIATVGQEIRANIAGVTASKFRKDGEETDIIVKLSKADREKVGDLEQIFVTNSQGTRIPVSSFARYAEGVSPISIARENQSRVITVKAGSVPGVSINEVQHKVETLINKGIPKDPAVRIEYGGDYEDLVKSLKQFVIIILMAIVLVFAVMASQFESFLDPFIVLFTLPLTLIGIVILYGIMGQPLNVMTAVGLLILVGVIVNNGIVLVDYTNLLRKRGLSLTDACAEAARSRLRPILMTTLTTVLGLTPMAFFPGEGSEMVQPIGQTVLGGLSFGTLMTLFLMPVLYYGFNRMREKSVEKKLIKRELKLATQQAKTGGVL